MWIFYALIFNECSIFSGFARSGTHIDVKKGNSKWSFNKEYMTVIFLLLPRIAAERISSLPVTQF